MYFTAETKQQNDALGGLVDITGEIYVGTAENPRSQTLIDYLKSMNEEPELITPEPVVAKVLTQETSSSDEYGDDDTDESIIMVAEQPLKRNEPISVCMVHDDPIHFTKSADFDLLQRFNDSLANKVHQMPGLSEVLVGTKCIGEFEGAHYRAEVRAVTDDEHYELYFYDFGNSGLNKREELHTLPAIEADVPRYAFQVELPTADEKLLRENVGAVMELEMEMTIDDKGHAQLTCDKTPLAAYLRGRLGTVQELEEEQQFDRIVESVVETVLER